MLTSSRLRRFPSPTQAFIVFTLFIPVLALFPFVPPSCYFSLEPRTRRSVSRPPLAGSRPTPTPRLSRTFADRSASRSRLSPHAQALCPSLRPSPTRPHAHRAIPLFASRGVACPSASRRLAAPLASGCLGPRSVSVSYPSRTGARRPPSKALAATLCTHAQQTLSTTQWRNRYVVLAGVLPAWDECSSEGRKGPEKECAAALNAQC